MKKNKLPLNRIAMTLVISSFSFAAFAAGTTFKTLYYTNDSNADYISTSIHAAGTIGGSKVGLDGGTTVGVVDAYGRPFLAKGYIYNCLANFDGQSYPLSGAFYFECDQGGKAHTAAGIVINLQSTNGVNPMPNSASVIFAPAQVVIPAHG